VLTRHLGTGTAGRVAAAAVGVCALLLMLVLAPRAVAGSAAGRPDAGTSCVVDPTTGTCTIQASAPGSTGGGSGGGSGGGGGGGSSGCTYQGTVIPCADPPHGYWDGANCYDTPVVPQPPASSPLWGGNSPAGGGGIYWEYCPFSGGANAGIAYEAYLPAPPPGQPVIDPAAVAQQEIQTMGLRAPVINTAPAAGGKGLVSMPVWMWAYKGLHIWGPITAGPLTIDAVTATAQVARVDWNMGNGTTVSCYGTGTPYAPADGLATSPTCGFPGYTHAGTYTVTASSYWVVTWTSTVTPQQTINLPPMTTQTTLTIDQAQALN
jgi:hypothetical protein